jgi:class 3 adenylate cyclase
VSILRKIVTVLCASVSAVTDGRVDPEALRRVLARALLAVKRPVERHSGSIESSAGGNVTGIFGVPAVHEDDALRALRAAAEIAEELQRAEGELGALQGIAVQHGIGVSTGEVMVGGALAPTGQPFAAAQRLAQIATPNDVLFDAATSRLATAVGAEPFEDAGFRLLKSAPEESLPLPRHRSRIVGRLTERRRLHEAFSQALAIARYSFSVCSDRRVSASRGWSRSSSRRSAARHWLRVAAVSLTSRESPIGQ